MSLVQGGVMTHARCLRAAFHDPDTDEALAGFVILAHLAEALAPTK